MNVNHSETPIKKTAFVAAVLVLLLAACTNLSAREALPTQSVSPSATYVQVTEDVTPSAYQPLPGDGKLIRANAFPESIDLLTVGSNPLQLELTISGYLPTPCHELRVYVPPPDEENNIKVEVYSVAEAEVDCAQVLRAFNATIPLGTYPAGSYWVWVNDERVGNFDT